MPEIALDDSPENSPIRVKRVKGRWPDQRRSMDVRTNFNHHKNWYNFLELWKLGQISDWVTGNPAKKPRCSQDNLLKLFETVSKTIFDFLKILNF